jgi:hypothetical protein
VLYITSTRLMRESENAVREHAGSGEDVWRRVCSQLIASQPRYAEWHASHEMKMWKVAGARMHGPQVLALRTVAVQQIHGTALVNYLRLGRVTGQARDTALRLFHRVSDLRDATLAEHRNYLVAASTQVCAHDLLELVGDAEGLDLIRRYELAYTQYFAMFCERAFALQTGKNYLLGALLPEVKDVADRLRLRIVGSTVRPLPWRPAGVVAAQTALPARKPAQAQVPRDRGRAGPRAVGRPVTPPGRTRTGR